MAWMDPDNSRRTKHAICFDASLIFTICLSGIPHCIQSLGEDDGLEYRDGGKNEVQFGSGGREIRIDGFHQA